MSELSKALSTYLEAERFKAQSNSIVSDLKNKKALIENGSQGVYFPEDAIKVYEVYQIIEEHNAKVKNIENVLTEAEETIQKYLLPLKGGSLSYTQSYKYKDQVADVTYIFSIIDGRVTHNRK